MNNAHVVPLNMCWTHHSIHDKVCLINSLFCHFFFKKCIKIKQNCRCMASIVHGHTVCFVAIFIASSKTFVSDKIKRWIFFSDSLFYNFFCSATSANNRHEKFCWCNGFPMELQLTRHRCNYTFLYRSPLLIQKKKHIHAQANIYVQIHAEKYG